MKNNKKKYYSLYQEDDAAVLNIFGDITSIPFEEFGEVSNVLLSKKLEELGDVSVIDVYINSYGGEVAEGLAIYNALKRHKAKIRTHVDGFACSIASVIFMAGDERIMPSTSCLMIHNPWMLTVGNANDLRKQADDLDVIAQCAINAYMEHINISESELRDLLDKETWLSATEATKLGFATTTEDDDENEVASQSVKSRIVDMLLSINNKCECNTESVEEIEEQSNVEDVEISETEVSTDTLTDEIEEETIEDGESPSDKATKIVAAFLNNLEKEILK